MKLKKITVIFSLLFALLLFPGCETTQQTEEQGEEKSGEYIRLVNNKTEKKVEIYVDQQHFASYFYGKNVKKPLLFPVYTASGIRVTRGFPLDPNPGERVDHPHQAGIWLNHGDVNNLDFWNNSDSIPENQRLRYGAIHHESIETIREGEKTGYLEIEASWERPDGRTLLEETTEFYFHGDSNIRMIDRITTLTASEINVQFEDSKEGMMAIRVRRELEQPSSEPVTVLNEQMNPVQVEPEENIPANGLYESSTGLTGDAVWGSRAEWVRLGAEVNGEPVGIVIMDHPDNPNHPTHWMARGYGLFAANPFGSKIYTRGRESLNFFLPQGESVVLKYRILIYDSEKIPVSSIEANYERFVETYQ